ncbi:copine-8 isoform X1 [Tachysurus ichikawai]
MSSTNSFPNLASIGDWETLISAIPATKVELTVSCSTQLLCIKKLQVAVIVQVYELFTHAWWLDCCCLCLALVS